MDLEIMISFNAYGHIPVFFCFGFCFFFFIKESPRFSYNYNCSIAIASTYTHVCVWVITEAGAVVAGCS